MDKPKAVSTPNARAKRTKNRTPNQTSCPKSLNNSSKVLFTKTFKKKSENDLVADDKQLVPQVRCSRTNGQTAASRSSDPGKHTQENKDEKKKTKKAKMKHKDKNKQQKDGDSLEKKKEPKKKERAPYVRPLNMMDDVYIPNTDSEESFVDRLFERATYINQQKVNLLREKVQTKRNSVALKRTMSGSSVHSTNSTLSNQESEKSDCNCISQEDVLFPQQQKESIGKYLSKYANNKEKSGHAKTDSSIMKMAYRPSNTVETNNTNHGKIFVTGSHGEKIPFWTVFDKDKDVIEREDRAPLTGEVFLEFLTGAVQLAEMPEGTIRLDAYKHMKELEDRNVFFTSELIFGNSIRSIMNLTSEKDKANETKALVVPMEIKTTLIIKNKRSDPSVMKKVSATKAHETAAKKSSDVRNSRIIKLMKPPAAGIPSATGVNAPPSKKKSSNSLMSTVQHLKSVMNGPNDGKPSPSPVKPENGDEGEDGEYEEAGGGNAFVMIIEPREMFFYKRGYGPNLQTRSAPFKPSGIRLNSRA